MKVAGLFSVSPKTAPPCECRKEQLVQLSGEIPAELNRRSLEGHKPDNEQRFTAQARCSCGKLHQFTIHANSINSLIKQEGVIPEHTV